MTSTIVHPSAFIPSPAPISTSDERQHKLERLREALAVRLTRRPHDQALADLYDRVTGLLARLPQRSEEAI